MTVPPTQAGEQLHQRLAPLFDNEINALSELRDTLRGRLRINGTEHVLELLWPKFMRFMQAYPEVELELVGETRFVDIVAERFDAGIRLGDDVERDMIAVRVTPDMQMCVVASPAYPGLKRLPQTPAGLMEHPCVNRSLPAGGVLAWEFRDPSDGRLVKVRPQGRFASSRGLLLPAALAGLGLLWVPRGGGRPAGPWRADRGAGGLGHQLPRLSPLLPEPPGGFTSVPGAGEASAGGVSAPCGVAFTSTCRRRLSAQVRSCDCLVPRLLIPTMSA